MYLLYVNIFQKFICNKYSEKQGIIENPDRNGWCNARSPESSIQFDNSLLIGETQRTEFLLIQFQRRPLRRSKYLWSYPKKCIIMREYIPKIHNYILKNMELSKTLIEMAGVTHVLQKVLSVR